MMKPQPFRVLLAVSLALFTTVHSYAATNLVANGSFEEMQPNGHLVGWKGTHGWHVERIADEYGGHYMQLASDPEQHGGWLIQELDLPNGVEDLRVAVRMRGFKIVLGEKRYNSPRVQLAQVDARGKDVAYGRVPELRSDSDWQDIELKYPLDPEARKLRISIGFNSSFGIMEVDDLVITPWTDTPTAVETPPTPPAPATKPAPTSKPEEPAAQPEPTAARLSQPVEMLPGGDFGGELVDGIPSGWKRAIQDLADQCKVVADGGNRFLRIVSTDVERTPRILTNFDLPEGAAAVELSMKVRGSDVVVGTKGYQNPRMQLKFQRADGSLMQYAKPLKLLRDQSEWMTISAQTEVPRDAAKAEVLLGLLGATGTVDFDDVSVLAKPEVTFESPLPAWRDDLTHDGSIEMTWHIDPSHASANDAGDGSESAPLATIAEAVRRADEAKAQNKGSRIVLHAGTYHEQILLPLIEEGRDTPAPLVIEAAEGLEVGDVVLTGSQTWDDGWSAVPNEAGVFTHPWPYDWGTFRNPWDNWKNERGRREVPFPEVCRRHEIVRLDGKPMMQVMDRAALEPGLFHVDEEADLLFVHMPEGREANGAGLQVGVLKNMLRIRFRQNVTVRGIVIEGAAGGIANSTTTNIRNSRNLRFEDLHVVDNGGDGFKFNNSENLVFRRVVASRNGGMGGGGANNVNAVIEDLDISGNNWRGAWGGFQSWHPCGMKILSSRNFTFKNVTAIGNGAHGLWIDWANWDFVIDNLVSLDNHGFGIYIEANPRIVTLKNSTLSGNDMGVWIANSENGVLHNNIVVDNRRAQIGGYARPNRPYTDRFTGEEGVINNRDWTWTDNVVVSTDPAVPVLAVQGKPAFLETLTATGNLYHHPDPERAFKVASLKYSFEEWQILTGADLNSAFTDPRFVDAARRDFTLPDDSPVHHRENWPKVKVEVVGIPGLLHRMTDRIEKSWETPHTLAENASPGEFVKLDLSAHANRPFAGEHAWIGMPIDQVAPGSHLFHNVPFEVAAPQGKRGDMGVMLRSARFTDTDGDPLPKRVDVELTGKAKAVYILHVAGYVDRHGPIARYELVYADGTTHGLDVVALSNEEILENTDILNDWITVSQVQDWWPNFPHFNSDTTRHAMVMHNEDPINTSRFLYSLQLENPHPEKPLKAVRLLGDEASNAGLMVLAVTALR